MAFSPDSKLIASSSRHFDKEKAKDAGTTTVSLAEAASGIVRWRTPFAGSARPVAFEDNGVVVLWGGEQVTQFLELKTGETLFQIGRSDNPNDGGRWNDLVILKQGRMEVTGGQDGNGKGTVRILDPDGP